MGLRFSRRKRLSKILAKNNEVRQKVKNRSNSTIGTALDELQVELDLLKEVTKKPHGMELDQTS